MARLDLQNAEGGVNGHKLASMVVDSQTSPGSVATGVQDAVSHHVIGIVSASSLFTYGYKYAQQSGVPVTGDYADGPEWGTKPNTNMFASDNGSVDPSYPENTLYGKVLKILGAHNLATYGYSISPDSQRAATYVAKDFERVGGHAVIEDTSVPFGGVNFTSAALLAKQDHVDSMWPNLAGSSNVALAEAYKQAGITLKASDFPDGYDPALIHSPAWSSVQGVVFDVEFHPFDQPNAGTRQMQAAMEKYDHWSKTRYPTYAEDEAWLGADLMIKGIEGAGTNPSNASVIKSLRSIKAYNGNGLLPNTIDYQTIFGHDSPQCVWLYRAEKNGYVPVQKADVCGTDIAGTGTTSSASG